MEKKQINKKSLEKGSVDAYIAPSVELLNITVEQGFLSTELVDGGDAGQVSNRGSL